MPVKILVTFFYRRKVLGLNRDSTDQSAPHVTASFVASTDLAASLAASTTDVLREQKR